MNTFMTEFNTIKENRKKGYSPVFSEMRAVKTDLKEFIPFNSLNAVLILLSTILISKLQVNAVYQVALVFIADNATVTLARAIFLISYQK